MSGAKQKSCWSGDTAKKCPKFDVFTLWASTQYFGTYHISDGSDGPVHMPSLTRGFAWPIHKVWKKRKAVMKNKTYMSAWAIKCDKYQILYASPYAHNKDDHRCKRGTYFAGYLVGDFVFYIQVWFWLPYHCSKFISNILWWKWRF